MGVRDLYYQPSGHSCSYIHIVFNPLNAELTPTSHLLALLGAHHILHVIRTRVKYVAAKILRFLWKNFKIVRRKIPVA
jgi:hypothetical protein